MNIFFLSWLIKNSVKYHCDKHVVKMVLETAQMLCTVVVLSGGDAPYRPVHAKHPCVLWAQKCKANWLWLRKFGLALSREYTFRYGKTHKSQYVIEALKTPDLPDGKFTPPPQCMPDEFKHDNPVIAYRKYYIGDKAKKFKLVWTKRRIPKWFQKK